MTECDHALLPYDGERGGFVCAGCFRWFETRGAAGWGRKHDPGSRENQPLFGFLPRGKRSRLWLKDRAVDVRARTIERKQDQRDQAYRNTIGKESFGQYQMRKNRITIQGD